MIAAMLAPHEVRYFSKNGSNHVGCTKKVGYYFFERRTSYNYVRRDEAHCDSEYEGLMEPHTNVSGAKLWKFGPEGYPS